MNQLHKGIVIGLVVGILATWVWARRSGGSSAEGG